MCSLITLRTCHCEEKAERGTRQSNACNGRIRTVRLGFRETVDRHRLRPRDDKIWTYEIGDSVHLAHCHCEKDDSLTRQSIVSRGRVQTCLFAYGFTVDRHGLRPRDDKMWSESVYRSRTTHHVIARRKRSERRGNPSCLEGGVRISAVRFLKHSGSPRATPSR